MNRFFALASFSLVSLLAVFAACSPYSPDLGSNPFRCGSNMECPSGYACKMSGTDNVCMSSGGATVDSGGSGSGTNLDCSKDSVLEGSSHNDTIQTASSTPVDSGRLTIAYSDLVICSMTDIDLYRIDVSQTEQVKATVVYHDATDGVPLDVAILLGTGAAAVNGQPNGANTVTANLPNAAAASSPYYVRVQAVGNGGNYYDLNITVTRP